MVVVLALGLGGIFVAVFLCLSAIGVFTNEVTGVSKSLAVVQAFSAAPQPLQQELQPGFKSRVLNPTLDKLVGAGRRITPSGYADRVAQKLNVAGNPPGWTVDRVMSLTVVGILGGLVGGLALGVLLHRHGVSLLVVTGLGGIAGYYGPHMYLHQKGFERTATIQKELPDALDLMSISVEAGLGFDAALSQVARNTTGPLAAEFARVLQEMQIGLGRSNALRAMGERSTLPDLRSFCSAMVQADAFGIPVGQVLRVQSNEIRVKRRQRAEEAAQKIPVKIMIPLVLFILPSLFIAVLGPAIIGIMNGFGGVG